jgi:hypothetical protein
MIADISIAQRGTLIYFALSATLRNVLNYDVSHGLFFCVRQIVSAIALNIFPTT